MRQLITDQVIDALHQNHLPHPASWDLTNTKSPGQALAFYGITDKVIAETQDIEKYYLRKELPFTETMATQCLRNPSLRSILKRLKAYNLPLLPCQDTPLTEKKINGLQKIISEYEVLLEHPHASRNQTAKTIGRIALLAIPEEPIIDWFFSLKSPYSDERVSKAAHDLRHCHSPEYTGIVHFTKPERPANLPAIFDRPPTLDEPLPKDPKADWLKKFNERKAHAAKAVTQVTRLQSTCVNSQTAKDKFLVLPPMFRQPNQHGKPLTEHAKTPQPSLQDKSPRKKLPILAPLKPSNFC